MRRVFTVLLLGTACTLWAAVPLGGTAGWGVFLVVLAGLAVVAGALRLVFRRAVRPTDRLLLGALDGLIEWANAILQGPRWEIVSSVALVALEALHRSRPWHTGLLGVALVCYLLAVHQAESIIPDTVLRGQGRVMATSLALLTLATGVAMVPSAGSGALSAWLEILGAVAAMVAGGLAVPV